MREELKTVVAEALQKHGAADVDFVIEHPADASHGDYATNAALVAANVVGVNPRELAERIVATIESNTPEYVDSISEAGPGFINFTLSRTYFSTIVADVCSNGAAWGRHDACAGETTLIEYTSPNLFKPLHIGNLVGNIIGESFTRLFEAAGADVKRLNYPSDIGLTVAKGVWGLQQTGGDPRDITALGEAYRAGNEAYEAGGAEKEAIEAVNRALYAGDNEALNTLRSAGIETSKTRLTELCEMLGTTFDHEITESEAGPVGAEIVRSHIGEVFAESDGAIVYKGEKAGLHTRVFISSQGVPTYEAKDLGNFALKQERYPEWSRSIIVTGNEQTEYFKVLYAALRDVFPEARERMLEHIPTGFLTLTTGKMSSRKGNVLTGESLLAELMEAARSRAEETRATDLETLTRQIAVGALKYQILKSSVGTDIVFDKEQALSFEGDSGPYLQYTNARINSVLEKAHTVGITPNLGVRPPRPQNVYEVERVVYRFPEVVEAALQERAPHHVVTYLTELASAFNTFYAHERIADESDEYAPYKAAVAQAVGQTLQNGLYLLGIEAPERM